MKNVCILCKRYDNVLNYSALFFPSKTDINFRGAGLGFGANGCTCLSERPRDTDLLILLDKHLLSANTAKINLYVIHDAYIILQQRGY